MEKVIDELRGIFKALEEGKLERAILEKSTEKISSLLERIEDLPENVGKKEIKKKVLKALERVEKVIELIEKDDFENASRIHEELLEILSEALFRAKVERRRKRILKYVEDFEELHYSFEEVIKKLERQIKGLSAMIEKEREVVKEIKRALE